MKKRILAMLLAGALTVSGLPITAIAADDTSASVTVDPIADAKFLCTVGKTCRVRLVNFKELLQ